MLVARHRQISGMISQFCHSQYMSCPMTITWLGKRALSFLTSASSLRLPPPTRSGCSNSCEGAHAQWPSGPSRRCTRPSADDCAPEWWCSRTAPSSSCRSPSRCPTRSPCCRRCSGRDAHEGTLPQVVAVDAAQLLEEQVHDVALAHGDVRRLPHGPIHEFKHARPHTHAYNQKEWTADPQTAFYCMTACRAKPLRANSSHTACNVMARPGAATPMA